MESCSNKQSYLVNGQTIVHHFDQNNCHFDQNKRSSAERLERAIQTGAIRVIDGQPLPVLVVDETKIFGLKHIIKSSLSINGKRLCIDTGFLLISAFPTGWCNSAIGKWAVSATLVDRRKNGRGIQRDLYSTDFDGAPSADEVQTELLNVTGKLAEFDYTPTEEIVAKNKAEFLRLIEGFNELPTREEYEARCSFHGFVPRPDKNLEYPGRYYDYGAGQSSMQKSIEQLETEIHLRRGRAYVIELNEADKKVQQRAEQVIMEGQLWEPCCACGAEPVYMPLHLCSNCWPK